MTKLETTPELQEAFSEKQKKVVAELVRGAYAVGVQKGRLEILYREVRDIREEINRVYQR